GSAGTLSKEDYEGLRKEVSGISGVSPEVRSSAQIAAGSANIQTQVIGVGEDYAGIRAWNIDNGANFTETDVKNANKVALIGQTTATTLFSEEDPVGKIIRIKTSPFIVVGVLAKKGMSMNGSDQDDIVLVPYTSAMVRLTQATSFRSFNVQAANATLVPAVQKEIADLLRQKHKILEGRDDDFIVRTQQEITEAATQTSKVMSFLLGSFASVSLVVGGIGIMNIMLVSVTERTREIGVRMAVGARGNDVLLQFLIEAIILSLVGGVLGIGCGFGLSALVKKYLELPTLVSSDSVIIAFGVSAFIGVFFGFYPARKASQLDPIEALRYE
ncbi:MAG: Multidrug transporter substrate-binding protein, partial [Verrucomicrobiales bacterium]|nr:Multidrug transporter substrate-binding protein [Verrucomicrobiales bacterium]